ncbi:DUF1802 family protein [Cohnella faecalis]|uniref:DUF1802 family protein n=1 Tax=Cohnella faecalis TaxID=2315694 RepID=A0A398CT69_9BACL|nr:DUF1802 family protein [Cohnella faecalis]RIE03958.1 DUF1802 family protein [Cohnella faecalis]
MNGQSIGLKEWAVAVKALEEGRQIIVLRKGGISEETRDFRLESPAFFLFPTFEHQRAELVKEDERAVVASTQEEAARHPGFFKLTSYAEVAEEIEVTDSATLSKLDELHIWTHDYAEERLKWKKTKPLHVLLLRVYKLEEPIELPMREEYNGCKSWTAFSDELPGRAQTPVLEDEEFAEKVSAVQEALKK